MTALGSSFAVLDGLHDYPQAGGQALRYALAALLLLGVARGRLARPTRRQLVRLALLAATGLVAFNLLVLAAERSMDPGSVGVIVGTVPVLLAIFGPLQAGRRPQRRLIVAGVVVAGGAALVQGLGGSFSVAGLAAALGTLGCEAAFSLLAAPLLTTLGPLTVSTISVLLAIPMLVAIALVADGPSGAFTVPTLAEAWRLAWLAVVVTAIAFLLWYSAIRRLGVERTGLFVGVLPIAALLSAAALGDSSLSTGRVLGVLAVAFGIAGGLGLDRLRGSAILARWRARPAASEAEA